MKRIVVCAAIQHRTTKEIVCGARHGNCLNFAMRHKLSNKFDGETWDCGFIDQDNKFMTREEAWKIADEQGQIRRPTGFEKDYDSWRPAGVGDDGLLFSENLY